MNPDLTPGKLKEIPLFRGMNPSELRQIADIARIESFQPRHVILPQGEESQVLYVLLEGKCDVLRKLPAASGASEPVVLATLEPFQHCGEMSFFHKAPHSASVRAATAARLIRIDHGEYMELISDGASAAYKLAFNCLQGTAERLRRMDNWVVELLSDGAPEPQTMREWSRFREKLFQGLNL